METTSRKILRSNAVTKRTGKSRVQIWRDVKAKNFPAPVDLGPNSIGWFEDEVDAWMASRPRRTYGAEIEAAKEYEAAELARRYEERQRTIAEAKTGDAHRYPRQCIFGGTTNDEKYLVDPTGNRRFWPIRCITIDLYGLKRDRDQLWAEAVKRYQAGEQWHLTDRDIITVASREQAQRQSEDPWDAKIQQHLESTAETTVANILTSVLEKDIASCNKADQMRVANALKRLGWDRVHTRKGKVWRKRSDGAVPKV